MLIDDSGNKESIYTVIHQGKGLFCKPNDLVVADDNTSLNKQYHLNKILDHITAMVVIMDKHCRIIKINKLCSQLTGYSLEEVKDKFFWQVFISQHSSENIKNICVCDIEQINNQTFYFYLTNNTGKQMLIMWRFSYIDDPYYSTEILIATGIDITESNQRQERLLFLSMHDPVTSLHNRAYFEEEMRRLENSRHYPVGMIIGDIDGLKLINDTMGHDYGDVALIAMAGILKNCFRKEDVVARIGGDEYAILFPRTSEKLLEEACKRIQESINLYNSRNQGWPLSISLGYALKESNQKSMKELYKEADKSMYKQKHKGVSKNRRALIDNLRKYLLIRNGVTGQEVIRLESLIKEASEFLKLPIESRQHLNLLSKYHDIGMVGIAEITIRKPGILSHEEYIQVQRHCEIGFHIAWAVPDLAPIAELILKHHEQWNGQGYRWVCRE
ncbi:hypothetical protein N752_07350 [Desulforamulus aquiferis]|nr:diguanylate cyclase [Desulforamulus aquiferis]RYD05705.1 hypothetical protein N752_07350 [Desulforamulus aquiferis]